ncbi:MAG: anthranilate phosphoribosyltransferase, partial [Flavobacteriales bacterium]|nr:anthranilate phosphoribosyltransferase [Flavobacteriales bacterium]
MSSLLPRLLSHHQLSQKEAKELMLAMTEGNFSDVQLASILTAFNMRPLSPKELIGFREGLMERCVPISLNSDHQLDLCGTGGDGKDTFNVSTLTAVVASTMGIKVVKHGNYGVSSVCGSSNVLESLGYEFTNNQDLLQKQLDEVGICFLHAPLFHPAMKHVASVRRGMKVKTIFNLLGPLVNPALPSHQVTGVYHLEVMRLYQEVLNSIKREYTIVHSLAGYDEISLTSPCKLQSAHGKRVIEPSHFGFKTLKAEDLVGGQTVEESAD